MSTNAWVVVAVVAVPLVAAALAVRLGRRRAAAEAAAGSGPTVAEKALGYTTFPDRRQTVSPESRYEARRIESACEARGLVLHKLVGDVRSYSGPDLERPALVHALAMLEAGEASCLVVTCLDRLSRSPANVGQVIDWVEELGARLVVIDIDLDTATNEGRVAARALVRVGALERERVGTGGVLQDVPAVRRRIAEMRDSGMTLQAIADTLNSEGVPTLRGGSEWRPSSVQAAAGYKRPRRQEP
jgi:resolvase-like protein/recombinase